MLHEVHRLIWTKRTAKSIQGWPCKHLETVCDAHILEYTSPMGDAHFTVLRPHVDPIWESDTFRTREAAVMTARFWRVKEPK